MNRQDDWVGCSVYGRLIVWKGLQWRNNTENSTNNMHDLYDI